MKSVVIINGPDGVGKDTFVKCCNKYASVVNISSIDPAKYASHYLLGYLVGSNGQHEEKTEKIRKLLKELKEISISYNNYPFTYVCEKLEAFVRGTAEVMFVHIREIPEIEKLKSYIERNYKGILKCITFKIFKEPVLRDALETFNSERYYYDFILLDNSNLNSLEKKAYLSIDEIAKCNDCEIKTPLAIKLIKEIYQKGGAQMNECKLKLNLEEIAYHFGTDNLEMCALCENFISIDGIYTCKLLENMIIKGE